LKSIEVMPILTLDGEGEAYVASYREVEGTSAPASVTLPRDIVESTVLANAPVALELRLDGTLLAYVNNASMRTVSCRHLSQLVAEAIQPDLVALLDDPSSLSELEHALDFALAAVRRVRKQADPR
jgi:hypothetical protein